MNITYISAPEDSDYATQFRVPEQDVMNMDKFLAIITDGDGYHDSTIIVI